jgi:hypothetical protein
VRVVPGQPGRVGGIHDVARPVLAHRLVDRCLEALLVDHDVGVDDRLGLLHRQLDVVWLLAGLGEVGHVGVVAGDPRGDVLQGVERRQHPESTAGCVGRAATACQHRAGHGQQDQGCDPTYCHDNHCQ